jgi:hypothetical protein
MEDVIRVLYKTFKTAKPETARSVLIGATIGVLTTLKLWVRVQSRGSVVLTAIPTGIDTIEEFSDEVAEEYFEMIATDVLEPGSFNTRLGTKRFERTDTTLTFRFAPLLSESDVAPSELRDVQTLSRIADNVICDLMDILTRTLARLRDQELTHGHLSFLIGFTAAAKVFMAYWGEGELASGIETLAEMDSSSRYRSLVRAG